MKLVVLLAALSVTAALAGCAEPSDAGAEWSEAALTSFTPLDRVTPAEIAATYARGVNAGLAECIAEHPSITNVDRSNLDTFYRAGGTTHWDVRSAIEGILEDGGLDAIATSRIEASIEPWAVQALSRHVDADGFYTPPREGQLEFYYAELATREAVAHTRAAAPGGKSLDDVRALWREVQRARGSLDSAWLRPVKVSAEPSLGEIRKAMRVPFDAHFDSWGNTAVDEFHEASEGPDRAPSFAPLATFLKSPAIQKRWYFSAYDSSGSTNILVVLDEHNQLWGMQMGYSE